MLYLIGLGLGDEKDVTVRGLEVIRAAERVYLEAYTSILGVDQAKLVRELETVLMADQEAFYGRPLIVADRDMVETESDAILAGADKADIAFLVVGDPFGATTHTDLVLRADELSIPVQTIHNASIMNAVGAVGLALYNYGQTISIPYFTESWRPDSWLERVLENDRLGLHTLCLLDIKVKEQNEENLARGRKIYEPARFMSSSTALQQLLSLLPDRTPDAALDPDRTLAISVSRIGSPQQRLVSGTLTELAALDESALGAPLYSLVLVGKRFHPVERDFAGRFAVDRATWDRVSAEAYACA